MSPTSSVMWELARAMGGLLLLPVRVLGFLATRARLSRELCADLERPAEVAPAPVLGSLPGRPLRVFVSCAEASGETHAANLVGALARRVEELGGPRPTFVGLGGERLRRAGVEVVGDPVERAAMGLGGWGSSLPFYVRLLRDAVAGMERLQPDVFVPVDSPALHVPLGRMARRRGVPVVHFVAPQYWGWAPWRARGYRRAVDLVLTILPFEPRWFERACIPAAHVGHPLLDELRAESRARPAPDADRPRLALLPGSRRGVIERNLPWMLRVLDRLRRRVPELSVVLPHARAETAALLAPHVRAAGAEAWIELQAGELHTHLAGARAAFSVSGTILVDLLHERLPAVVVYRLGRRWEGWMYENLLAVPWFSSPNLLAAREVLPEFCFHGEGPQEEVVEALVRALGDEQWRRQCRSGLDEAARRLGPPGATSRAADHALALALARNPSGNSSRNSARAPSRAPCRSA